PVEIAEVRVQHRESISQGKNEPAAFAQAGRSDRLAHVDASILAGCRIEDVNRVVHDVHPDQGVAALVPDRSLADTRVSFQDYLDFLIAHCQYAKAIAQPVLGFER